MTSGPQVSTRRLQLRSAPASIGGLDEQKVSHYLVQCSDDPPFHPNGTTWRNASFANTTAAGGGAAANTTQNATTNGSNSSGGGGDGAATTSAVISFDDDSLKVFNLAVDCDARYWRVTLLDRFGTQLQTPAAIVRLLAVYGVPTPSPPPPPPPPMYPPLSPPPPMYKPDYEAMERERQICIRRENLRMARLRVANVSVLSELPQKPGCGWSAAAALAANQTLENLRPLRGALARPAAASLADATAPVEPLRELVRKLLPTRHYGPLLGHVFDRQFHEVVLGEPPDPDLVGTWGTWRRGGCADASFTPGTRGYGFRVYDSVLHDLAIFVPAGTWDDACSHYINLPVVLGRVRLIVKCSYTDPMSGLAPPEGIWGQVHVRDPACGACRTRNPDCMGDGGEATRDVFVNGQMARDVDLNALDAAVANFTGNSSLFLSTPRSRRARAELRLGWPHKDQANCAFRDCQLRQEAAVRAWAHAVLSPALHRLQAKYKATVKLYWELDLLQEAAMEEVLASDIGLSLLPLPLGFAYLLLYTGSVFLAAAAALQLALAWPAAFFIYRYWFEMRHVEVITLLAAPLTAFFSLDAMSLLMDAWHTSAQQPAHVLYSLTARMDFVMLDAGISCLHSIAVGCAAVAAGGLSPWLAISHFGLFCALQLVVQLLLALLLLPACLVLYHDYLEPKPNLCFFCCVPGGAGSGVGVGEAVLSVFRKLEQTSTDKHHATRMIEATLPGVAQPEVQRGSRLWPLPRLLGRYALPLVRHRKGRRGLLAFFAVAMVPVLVGVFFAEAETKPRGPLQERHPLTWPRLTWERAFGISAHEEAVTATLLWGVDGVERSGWWGEVNLLRNSSMVGRVRWREAFAFDEPTQRHLAHVCEQLREQPWVQRDAGRPFWRGAGRVHCFLEDFQQWLANASGRETHAFGPAFPVPADRKPLLALEAFLNAPMWLHQPAPRPADALPPPAFGARWQAHVGLSRGVLRFLAVVRSPADLAAPPPLSPRRSPPLRSSPLARPARAAPHLPLSPPDLARPASCGCAPLPSGATRRTLTRPSSTSATVWTPPRSSAPPRPTPPLPAPPRPPPPPATHPPPPPPTRAARAVR